MLWNALTAVIYMFATNKAKQALARKRRKREYLTIMPKDLFQMSPPKFLTSFELYHKLFRSVRLL